MVVLGVSFLGKDSGFTREPVVHRTSACNCSNFHVQELRRDLGSIGEGINPETSDDVLVRRKGIIFTYYPCCFPSFGGNCETCGGHPGREEKQRRWKKRGICSFWW